MSIAENKEKMELIEETQKLIEEFKAGHDEAFDRLVILYSPRLFRTACGLLGSRQDAEEVVQDAFVRAYRALNQFRGDSSFETWMHRIVINLSRNRFHWNRRRGDGVNTSLSEFTQDENGLEQMPDLALPDERQRPDFALENTETENGVKYGISRLPETLRETMVLRHLDDLPYDEIARLQGCKVGTIKSRLARGRELLKGYLQNIGLK